MNYGIYHQESIPSIDSFVNGAHIAVICKVYQYVSQIIRLEDEGWEVRDCIKFYIEGDSLQIGLLRKPFKKTVANNTLINGCGGINIDACRVGTLIQNTSNNGRGADKHKASVFQAGLKKAFEGKITVGRFPANLILDANAGALFESSSLFFKQCNSIDELKAYLKLLIDPQA